MTTRNADWAETAWRRTVEKVSATSERIRDGFPHASVNGRYVLEPAHWWTAGFWPGLLWLLYRETKRESFRAFAESCEAQLDRVVADYYKLDHDIGFMWTLTSVARYKLLGDEDAKRRALLAANLLAARFNIKGRYIRAWNPWKPGENNAGWAIIDCMMNLPLLYWASSVTGDPRYAHVAVAHADTALEHFLRPDGSARHIVVFDAASGERVGFLGGQGHDPESAWSRGAAWALYGMALSFRHTGETRYREAAERAASFFLANLPEDAVPPWDFRLPEGAPSYPDSSAGAIAACGLLLLSEQTSGEAAMSAAYRSSAERLLLALYERCGAWNLEEEGLLLHGTSHVPEGRNIDVPLIYGDYFFVEGLSQLLGHGELFW